MDIHGIEEADELELISALLVARAAQMGVSGFSLKGKTLNLEDAMDQEGPLAWALFMHADIISKLSGIKGMPFRCVIDEKALYGNRAGIVKNALPVSFASHFLDGALEHAIATGIMNIGCTVQEWEGMPDDLRVLPIEDYFNDLKANWIIRVLEVGSSAEKVLNWPVLLDFDSLNDAVDMAIQPSEDKKMTDLVRFTPNQ